MEQLFQRWKKLSKQHRKAAGTGAAVFMVLLLMISLFWGIKGQTRQIPENPIKENQGCSMVALASTKEVLANNTEGLKGRISEEQTIEESEKQTEKMPESETELEPESETATEPVNSETQTETQKNTVPPETDSYSQPETNQRDNQNGSDSNPKQTDNNSGTGDGSNDNSGSGNVSKNKKNNKKNKDKNVSKDGEKDTEYFRTTIEDGAVLSSAELCYEIEHLTKHKVKRVRNTVNDNKPSVYNGTVKLAQGENTLLVEVTYLNDAKTSFTVSKKYTLYYEPDKLVIHTNLTNQKVKKETISFKAYGKLGEEELPVIVTVNGSTVSAAKEYYYENVVLSEGANEIILYAEKDGQTEQSVFNITYEKSQETQIRFDTDLQDGEVHKKKYNFYAQAFWGSERLTNLTVTMEGNLVESQGESQYEVLLEEGANHIRLAAEKDGVYSEIEYTVTYIRQVDGQGDGEGNSEAPEVTCTLGASGSNLTTAGSVMSFQIFPKDYKGNGLGAANITITCFGDQGDNQVSLVWENQGDISYKVYLTPGNNTLLINVTDAEDNVTQLVYSIFCEATVAGEPIGTAHISVEATTVGSGILVSEDVPIYEGEPASRAVVRLLEECGYRVLYSGALDSGFYLAHIEADSNFVSGAIPDDLRKMLEEKLPADALYLNDFYPNSLGEFDFTHQSGWMYQVNGVYPNYSMADCYLQNGDTMRIRFTLAYGADIGGGGANGNGTNEGASSSWGYEW